MKKLIYLIIAITVLGLIVAGCNPVVPPSEQSVADDKAPSDKCTTIQSGELKASDGSVITVGYDDWGYNYQAHLFNGFYCDSYRDAAWCQEYKDVELMMKWNDAWISNKDCDGDGLLDRHFGYDSYIGSGAWLTNHQSGNYNVWDLTGDWVLDFGGPYIHNMTITDDSCGSFSGTGSATFSPQTWTVTGGVDGDNVIMTITYDNSGYIVNIAGIIAENGTMGGDWTTNAGQAGTWESTTGNATLVDYMWDYFVKIVAVPKDAVNRAGVWYTADETEIGPDIWGEFAVVQEVSNDACAGLHGVQYKSPAGPGLGQYGPE